MQDKEEAERTAAYATTEEQMLSCLDERWYTEYTVPFWGMRLLLIFVDQRCLEALGVGLIPLMSMYIYRVKA